MTNNHIHNTQSDPHRIPQKSGVLIMYAFSLQLLTEPVRARVDHFFTFIVLLWSTLALTGSTIYGQLLSEWYGHDDL